MVRERTELGKEIMKRLVELNMTKTGLAKMLGTHENYLTHIVYGTRSGAKHLAKISEILGLDLNRFKKSA